MEELFRERNYGWLISEEGLSTSSEYDLIARYGGDVQEMRWNVSVSLWIFKNIGFVFGREKREGKHEIASSYVDWGSRKYKG